MKAHDVCKYRGGEGGHLTVWEALAACRRRWYVVVLGLIMTAGTAQCVHGQLGVYTAQSQLVFLAPTSERYPNSLGATSGSLTSTAGVVERLVNADNATMATVSAAVTLVDKGVTEGQMIQLPNFGGQWAYNFSKPVLDVQVVGDNSSVVQTKMAELQIRIQRKLQEIQDQAGVDRYNRITTQASPSKVQIAYRHGDPRRAVLAASVLGFLLTIGAATTFDGWCRIKESRRLESPGNRTADSAQDSMPSRSRHLASKKHARA